jgi:hypothetical protein
MKIGWAKEQKRPADGFFAPLTQWARDAGATSTIPARAGLATLSPLAKAHGRTAGSWAAPRLSGT